MMLLVRKRISLLRLIIVNGRFSITFHYGVAEVEDII